MAQPHPTPPPILRTHDKLLDDIFLRLPTAADLAHASAACASFRRLITNHAFLHLYRALHPPPLIGVVEVNDKTFFPAQPPHPTAVAAHAFAGFDFSCSSFLPTNAGCAWRPLDFFDGRAHFVGVFESNPEVRGYAPLQLLVRDLAVCDPVHRRYILLPTVPGDLTALVPEPDLLDLEAFLAPGDDEEDPLSFGIMFLAQCRTNMALLVFSSSLGGQWHALTFDQWTIRATFDPLEDGLLNRQFVRGRFCWHSPVLNKLLLLDTRSMEFSAISLPPEQRQGHSFVIVEEAEGMLGMLTRFNEGRHRYWLEYSILRNNQWHPEKVIPLPVKHDVYLLGVVSGYVLIEGFYYTTPSQEECKLGFFSVDVKTLQVELFGDGCFGGLLYAGFTPSLCVPTI